VFDLLRHRVKPQAHLIAFDLLEIDGRDLKARPIELRKAELARLIQAASAVRQAEAKMEQSGGKLVHVYAGLQLCAHTDQPGDVVFAHACQLGCEGIVSKRLGSRYRAVGRIAAGRKRSSAGRSEGRRGSALLRSRLEAVAQHADEQEADCNHAAIMF
jgi:ATP-dependent DNA ligase